MDNYLYNETLASELNVEPFQEKQVLYVQDQNGGSYNGQIQIDTSVLASSGKYLSFSEAYLEIPYIITMKSTADISGADVTNGLMCGLKCGNHQIIDSIQCDYNNSNVIGLQPYTNFYVQYKLMSSWSADDVAKYGDITGFIPDNPLTSRFTNAAGVDGDGSSNNRVNPTVAIAAADYATATNLGVAMGVRHNDGFLRRLQNTSFPVGSYNNNVQQFGYNANAELNSVALSNSIGKSYYTTTAVQSAVRVFQWNMLLTIRLKDLSDFFDKIPLIKGAFMRFTINYNTILYNVTTNTNMLTNSLSMLSGRTNPVMLASSSAGNPMFNNAAIANAAGGLAIRSSVGASPTTNVPQAPLLNACRLYVPSYTLNPIYEEQIRALVPVKTVNYSDIYNYNIINVGAGGSFNSILTNGIVNPKMVVVIPMANGTSSGVAGNLSPYQSIFDSAPGTTQPLSAITQFNIGVSGKNLFQQSNAYDFEDFMNEISSANALNGGVSVGLTSGLISRLAWDNGYRYYVGNVARRMASSDSVPLSITVQGINNTSINMDYICFIVFERKINIDMLTGDLL